MRSSCIMGKRRTPEQDGTLACGVLKDVVIIKLGFPGRHTRRAQPKRVRDLVATGWYKTVGIGNTEPYLCRNLIANLPYLPQPAAQPVCSVTPAAACHAYTGRATARRARIPTFPAVNGNLRRSCAVAPAVTPQYV